MRNLSNSNFVSHISDHVIYAAANICLYASVQYGAVNSGAAAAVLAWIFIALFLWATTGAFDECATKSTAALLIFNILIKHIPFTLLLFYAGYAITGMIYLLSYLMVLNRKPKEKAA